MKAKSTAILTGGLLLLTTVLPVSANMLENTSVKFNGYVKLDAISSSYSNGTIGSGSIGRDFYVPGLTPVNGVKEGSQVDAHIKQTRFRFTALSKLDDGESITAVLEFDFQATPDGNERVSNSYQPRIRHAFLKYQNWLMGQTWSTFQDVKVLPESVDFVGSTEATIFVRQSQIRYSINGFDIALENPESTITPFQGGSRIVSDDNALPDLILRYTYATEWGHFAIAGLLRQLEYVNKQNGNNIDDSVASYGLSLTSKIKLGKDDIRLMFNWGSGLGRYLGLNTANGAVLDANNNLEVIDSIGYAIAYRHWWNSKWRSNIIYSAINIDNPITTTGLAVTEQTYSARINLMHSPSKSLTFGGEYAFAKRELESGADGDMNRLQFTAKYTF